MSITKKIAGLVGVLGLTVAGFAVTTMGPASAQPGPTQLTAADGNSFCEQSGDDGENGAKLCWEEVGDEITVCDIDHDDDMHAWGRVKWKRPNGTWGKSSVVEDGGDDGCDGNDLDIKKEGLLVVGKVCVQNEQHKPKGCDKERGRS